MADSCFNLTGVFLDVVQPELWPPNQKENDAFIWDFLKTLRDNTPSRWFIGIYTNKSSFSSIVGPYWVRRKNVDLRLWLPEHQVRGHLRKACHRDKGREKSRVVFTMTRNFLSIN